MTEKQSAGSSGSRGSAPRETLEPDERPSDQPDDYDRDYYDSLDDDDEEFDCHRGKDGSCGLAGTEECDWECPYSR